MRPIGLCFLLMAMQLAPLAQQTGVAQAANNSYALWLARSQTLTTDLIKDSSDLPSSGRALLWTRLAQRWWQNDPEKARSWMLKSIEFVEAVPNKENPDERLQRLTTTRLLLPIVASLDRKLSERLVAVLTQDSEHQAKEHTGNADALVEAAVSLVDTDPQRATELGALALRVGYPTQIDSLIFGLRGKDAKLGDALFLQTLAAARQTFDADLLNSLANVAFPGSRSIDGPVNSGLSDALKTELLKVYVAFVQTKPIYSETRSSVCSTVVSLISPVLFQFDRLLPRQAAIVRQSVNQCQALHPLAQQMLDDATRDQPLKTVDDLLKAGDDAKDLQVRAVYQFRAASLAQQHNDFDRALKILDSMSLDSREFMGGSWEAYRWGWAATSALQHLKSEDVYGMRQIINSVPGDLQSFAKIAFVDQLPVSLSKDLDPTLEFLSDARSRLRRSSLENTGKAGWYFALLRLTVKYQPADASAVLKEAIAVLNHADEARADEKKNSQDDHSKFDWAGIFSASLIEMDEYTVGETVSSISSADTRVQVRLELLRVCLERLRSSKQVTPNQKRAA
jgi:hypothetical protein